MSSSILEEETSAIAISSDDSGGSFRYKKKGRLLGGVFAGVFV